MDLSCSILTFHSAS